MKKRFHMRIVGTDARAVYASSHCALQDISKAIRGVLDAAIRVKEQSGLRPTLSGGIPKCRQGEIRRARYWEFLG